MIAKNILSIKKPEDESAPLERIDSEMSVLDVLPRLLDTTQHRLTVTEDGRDIGIIDESSLLEGIGKMIAPRDDCSVITLECRPEDYSASIISHAIEDTDAHLVDLFSSPGNDGNIKVTLRVRHSDPSAAVRSLERYDFHVLEAHGSSNDIQSLQIATERLLALQALLNV